LDVSIPVIFISAHSLGKKGNESKEELDKDKSLLKTLKKIREAIIKKAGMPYSELIPKISLVSAPSKDGNINSRYFTPINCHAAHAVTGALCLSIACKIPGTVPFELVKNMLSLEDSNFVIEHPSGIINISIDLTQDAANENGYKINRAEFIRTARPLFVGNVYIKD